MGKQRDKLEKMLKEISAVVNSEELEKPIKAKKLRPEPNLDKIVRAATKLGISYGYAMALYHDGRIDLDGNKLR